MRHIRLENSMLDGTGNDPLAIDEETRSQDVYLVSFKGLGAVIKDKLSNKALVKNPRAFWRATQESLLETVAADPTSAPQYKGPETDGNPIAFFVRHYRLFVEARNYYQADLQRDCPKLFNAVRDALRYKDYRENAQQADDELVRARLEPYFRGRRVRDIADIGELLPSRKKNIVARRPKAVKRARVVDHGLTPAK
jgi:hypothetical protein